MNLFAVGLFLVCSCSVLPSIEGRRCHEVFCASVVSKCMLTQACKCELGLDPEKCTCCADCAKCLGHSYQRCCSCLDMCDTSSFDFDPNDSQVGDLRNPFVELFETVTQVDDPLVEGVAISYPADLALDELAMRLRRQVYHSKDMQLHNLLLPMPRMGINCTVVFMDQCYSASKCKDQCQLIGAGSYRYFFNGCCECIGPTCLNYGINVSRCTKCSELDDYDFDYSSDEPIQSNAIEEDYKH